MRCYLNFSYIMATAELALRDFMTGLFLRYFYVSVTRII